MKKFRWFAGLMIILATIWGVNSNFLSPHGDTKVSYEPSTKVCYSGGKDHLYRYCIYSAKLGTNGDVAYLLHGKGLDENTWNDETYYTSLIQQYWQTSHIQPPTIVSVSFGPVWLFTRKSTHAKSGLFETFINDVIPDAEKHTGAVRSRLLFGESMGGLNALFAATQAGKLFRKVAALCPPLYKLSPFASYSEIRSFLDRTGAEPKNILGILKIARDYASNQQDWSGISPLSLLDKVNVAEMPEIYLSCGLYDKYGNFEGAEAFAERAKRLGVKIQWRPIYGGHCSTDIVSLADFLTKP